MERPTSVIVLIRLRSKTVTATSKKRRRSKIIMANHPLRHSLVILAGFAFATTPARGAITQINMTTWSSNDCGGYGVRVKVVNAGGETCLTSEKDFSKGEELVWNPEGGDCANMEVTTNSTVYIQTDHGNDFCPEFVYIKTPDGMYETHKLSRWYDYQSNDKEHKIAPGACRSTTDCDEDHVCLEVYSTWHASKQKHCQSIEWALAQLREALIWLAQVACYGTDPHYNITKNFCLHWAEMKAQSSLFQMRYDSLTNSDNRAFGEKHFQTCKSSRIPLLKQICTLKIGSF